MLLGADTGFLLKVILEESTVIDYWNRIEAGTDKLIIPVITLNELLVYFYKRGKGEEAKEFIERLNNLDNVYFADLTKEIAERSAGYRYAYSMHTIDSLILSTFITKSCDLVLSTDSDLLVASNQGIIDLQLL